VWITQASRSSPLVQPSVLLGYQASMNPYVGCAGACTFCYAQQMIKEPGQRWGGFVRTRDHIRTRLASQWTKFAGRDLLIGTMTDPYQPLEQQLRLTRTSLEILLDNQPPPRLGIFTRYPAVLEDLDLLRRLPQVTIHMSISPFTRADQQAWEPGVPANDRRFAAIAKLVKAGIDCQSQVSPLTPGFSDDKRLITTLQRQLANSGLSMARLDPLQQFSEAKPATEKLLERYPKSQVQRYWDAMADVRATRQWAHQQRDVWRQLWEQHHVDSPVRLVWANHVAYEWVDLRTGEVTSLPRHSTAP